MSTGEDRIRNIDSRTSARRRASGQGDGGDDTRRPLLQERAEQIIDTVRSDLLGRVTRLAASARPNREGTAVTLRNVELSVPDTGSCEAGSLTYRGSRPPFDVIAHTEVAVRMPTDQFGYEGRSHSLWYCDARVAGQYHWYETAFMVAPGFRVSGSLYPFSLPPGEDAARGLSVLFEKYEVAVPFSSIEGDELTLFVDRWLNYLADAVEGKLRRPVKMPEQDPKNSWRRGP
ncbi:MAG: hypothetical protein WD208_02845 [Dehalococcoidia bacterium]